MIQDSNLNICLLDIVIILVSQICSHNYSHLSDLEGFI